MPEGIFFPIQPTLRSLLDEVHTGQLQLPDFQRDWVWDDEHIRKLLASISLSYPIGAVMFLEAGETNARFRPRLVAGVRLESHPRPDRLILDGQQRLTSVYLSLVSGRPVPTQNEKREKISRVYYIDMTKCMDPDGDRVDAIISVPPERILKSDFGRKIELDVSSRTKELAESLYPTNLLFDIAGHAAWRTEYYQHHDYARDRIEFFNKFEANVWQSIYDYKVPVIVLVKNTSKDAVCQVFEQVNTGGVSLTVFELMTATYAADDYALREDWTKRKERLSDEKYRVLHDLDETTFLTAVTLLASYRRSQSKGTAVSCKRKDVLNLTLQEYKDFAPLIEMGLTRSARLMEQWKIFESRGVPYSTQFIPLSAICADLGSRFEEDSVKQKISQWYWCGVFGELYGGASETRFALDVPETLSWIRGGDLPRTIQDSNFSPTRLLGLQTRQSAAYKGLFAVLMKSGSNDFISGDELGHIVYFDKSVDIHHLFPEAYCRSKGLRQRVWNSAVNKSPLTSETNRIVGGRSPSSYLATVSTRFGIGTERQDAILASHLVRPDLLREDRFDEFIQDRATRLLDAIERSTGKAVTGRDSEEVIREFGAPLHSAASY